MADYTELKAAATYAAQHETKFSDEAEEMRALQQFHEEVDPEAVLALIAESARLRSAAKTLERLGYRDNGGELWKPPLGQKPDFSLMDQLKAENDALREEVALDDKLIADRDRLLNMFECPVHGQCIPYAMDQVEALRKDAERYRWTCIEGNWVARFHGKWRAHVGEYGDNQPTDWYPSRGEAIDAAMVQGEQS